MNIRETQDTYRQLGLTLTPLRGKDAYLKGWNKREYTEKEWDTWTTAGCNIGLVLGSRSQNIVCIDIDPRNGGGEWQEQNQDIVDACQIIEESGRGDGGLHLFFLDPSHEFQKKCQLAKGIDFLTTGSQVVLAPSIHPATNNPFKKVKGDLSLYSFTITELPEKVKGQLREIGVNQRRESQKPFETGRDITKEERRVLQENLENLEGRGSRHDTIVKWVTDAVAAGLPDPEIVAGGEDWLRNQGREPQPMEIPNWIDFAKKGFESGNSYISDNRIAPERFLAGEGGEGFEPVSDPVPEAHVSTDWESSMLVEGKGGKMYYRKSLANIQKVLANHKALKGKLAYNEVTCCPIKYLKDGETENFHWDSPAEKYSHMSKFNATDTAALHHWYSDSKYQWEVAKQDMSHALLNVSRERIVNPVKDWLMDLKWDGEERLKFWLTKVTGCEPDYYNRRVGELMILSMVSRILVPGIKWDNCFILEGEQGNGKSTLCNLLAGDDENYCESPVDLKDIKSIVEQTIGALVLELGEVDQYFTSYSSSKLKQFISTKIDTVRLPYASEAVQLPRSYIVIGTTNKSEYLQDSTGERRYWPVKTGTGFFDLEYLEQNRDNLFAEALATVKEKGVHECIKIEPKMMQLQNKETETRKDSDTWQETIVDHMEKHRNDGPFRIDHILKTALFMDASHTTQRDKGRVKKILDGLGYELCRFRIPNDDKNYRGYRATERSPKWLQPYGGKKE